MTDAPGKGLGTRYAGDTVGLICGWSFAPEQTPQAIREIDQALPHLQGQGAGFVWLHFNLSHAGTLPWLQAHAGLSEEFFEALDTGSRSTRLERDGDALFGVINDLTFDFGFDASDVSTLWVAARERVVISARRQALRAIDRLRTEVKDGASIESPAALVEHLLRWQADELQRIVRRSAERVDDIEDELLAGRFAHGAELARLRRVLVRLQRLLAPEPSALQRLLVNPPDWVSETDIERLHGANEEFALVLRDIANLQERSKLMQDEAASRVAEANGRSLFTLTMVTVLALPINLIAGLFGMNVSGIPGSGGSAGFWSVLGVIAIITGLLAWLVIRRLGPRR